VEGWVVSVHGLYRSVTVEDGFCGERSILHTAMAKDLWTAGYMHVPTKIVENTMK
jgi:hypothetical protein